MPRITLPFVALVALAGVGDLAGAEGLAFYALLAAVPASAASALVTLDRALGTDHEHRPLHQAWLQAGALVLVLLSAAVRAPVLDDGSIPRLASSALVGCLVLLTVQLIVSRLPARRRSSAAQPALER